MDNKTKEYLEYLKLEHELEDIEHDIFAILQHAQSSIWFPPNGLTIEEANKKIRQLENRATEIKQIIYK